MALHVGIENALALVVKGHDPKPASEAGRLVDCFAHHGVFIKLVRLPKSVCIIDFVVVLAWNKSKSVVVVDWNCLWYEHNLVPRTDK